MSWRPLPRIAFAICVYPFQPSSTADLPLEIGDELYIIEQGGRDGAWYRGYLVAPPSLLAGLTSVKGQTLEARVFSGIFPRCCVDVREELGEGRVHTYGGQGESNGEPRINGDNALSGPGVRRVSRADRSSVLESAIAETASKRKSLYQDGRTRRTSQMSRRSIRTEQSHPLMLPMSPMSPGFGDHDRHKPPAPVPMLKIGDETPTSAQEPLVDEIASCLREWQSTKLHELLLARKYSTLEKMSSLVERLDSARRQLLHKVLTAQELAKLREATVWDLVAGNKTLSGEVIVRSPSERGRILTGDDSAIEITRLQSMMSLLSERPVPASDEHSLHHLLVNVKSYNGSPQQATALSLSLCSMAPGGSLKPLSEAYSVDILAKDVFSSTVDERMKTIFTDLSTTDIGEGAGAGTTLYLVAKLLANESIRGSSSGGPAHVPRESTSSTNASAANIAPVGSVKSGRRSVMWGSRSRKDTETKQSAAAAAMQAPAVEKQVAEVRPDSSARRTPPSRDQKFAKRTIAAGIVKVDHQLREKVNFDEELILWTPQAMFDEQVDEAETPDAMLTSVLPSPSGRYKKASPINRLQMQFNPFIHNDAETLIEKTPTLLQNINQTNKIGFSGAPTKPRSDIYVTLSDAFLPKNSFLSHPKSGTVPLAPATAMANLQLTLEVRKQSGERIDGCIFPSGNSAGHTAWRTTAADRGEGWNQTIRLAIAPEDVPGCHMVMSIADAPGFPFALCWMPLWTQDAFVRDGEKSLALYKYDEYTSSMISGRGAYMALPWSSSRRKDETVTGPMAAVNLSTYLCSTQYSQDPTLLSLLKWKEQGAGDLTSVLKRFTFVPEIEIVKLLNEVFDALFEILVEYAGTDEYEDLVFNALVVVLGIVHDRRFNVAPLVDQYAESRFKYPFATSCLMRSFTRLLTSPENPETSRKLRATFKVGRHVFKLIISARHQQKEKEAGIGITTRQPTFNRDLQEIFVMLEALVKNPAATVIGTKTLVVQHFHSWLPELTSILSTKDILDIAVNFVDACAVAQGKLALYKLVLIIHLSQLEMFKVGELWKLLVDNTARWLEPHWGTMDGVTDQWRDQVRLCCSIVATQLEGLGKLSTIYIAKVVDSYRTIQATGRKSQSTLSLLFPTTYPFPTKAATSTEPFDEALAELAATLAALSNEASDLSFGLPKNDLADFLFDILQVYISVLDGDAFPSSWLSVHIYHHKSSMRSLDRIQSVLASNFLPSPDEADQFSTELWRAFFDALIRLVGSEALALETFPEQKRRAVWKIAGDVRELGADLLRRSWEAIGWDTGADDRNRYGLERLGGFQVQYVPGLVAPVVELCLSVHQDLRGVAIEILQTMIVSEWTLSQDLALIQAEMIDCLDQLFQKRHQQESVLQKLFIGELIDLFEPLASDQDDPLFIAVKNLIATIDELLDLLVAVYSTEDTGEIFKIMDTLHLMEFLKDMHKEDTYIRYVHQLAQLQADAKNFTEAGLALRLHAELYEWDPAVNVESLHDPAFPAQTSFERKEQIFFQMIKHYEDGLSWDNALGSYAELAAQYEHNIFDFAKLARAQRAMATIYESISRGERVNPRYFRVVYKGLGFPVGLRDKQFIFEGLPNDRQTTFTDRMQQQHPSAQILSAGTEEEVEGQYLQIYPVSPQKDLLHPVYQRSKVAQPIRDYYLLSRPTQFTATSRRQLSEGGIKDQTINKMVYTTAESFPTILRRSEITDATKVTLGPMQCAVERTARKTAELTTLEKQAVAGDESSFHPLTEALMISVDPASETSVSRYRELLPHPGEDDENGEEEPGLDLLENALKVALIDHAITVKRCLALYSRPAQQATRADLTQRFEATYLPELEILNPAPDSGDVISPTPSWLVSETSLGTSALLPDIKADAVAGADDNLGPTREARPTRHDKNRLSLNFMKRTSVLGSRSGIGSKEAPRIEELPDGDDTNAATSRSQSKDHQSKNRFSLLYPTNTNGSAAGDSHGSQRSASKERPETGTTERSGAGHATMGDRMGSVKKRLSILNIGRKESKNSVRDRVGESLAEE